MAATEEDAFGLVPKNAGDSTTTTDWSHWGSSNVPRPDEDEDNMPVFPFSDDSERFYDANFFGMLDLVSLDSPLDCTIDPVLSAELFDMSFWSLPFPRNSEFDKTTDSDSQDLTVQRMTRCSSPIYLEASNTDGRQAVKQEIPQQSDKLGWKVGPNIHTCPQCPALFPRVSEIEEHAKITGHKPFLCPPCNRSFSRRDAWTRHCDTHGSKRQYPCPRCEKYRGAGAFRRRDHLRQHLKKFHRVHPNVEFPKFCPFINSCKYSAIYGTFIGFERRKHYTKHMREIHGEETHGCTIAGCVRAGTRGFARLNDLERHMKMAHGSNSSEDEVVESR